MPEKSSNSEKRIKGNLLLTQGKWDEIAAEQKRLNHGDQQETLRMIIELGLDGIRKLGED